MKEFAGRVAVVTGAGSGIGYALAERSAGAGMRVVLADVERPALEKADAALRAKGADVLTFRCDVMREGEVRELADAVFSTWGKVHLLCNNAGVGGSVPTGACWDVPQSDWDWVLGVNFFGVLHGIRHFVPRMLAGGEEGHVVNTASVAGLVAGMTGSPYTVSKFGVVALTEHLYKDLKSRRAKVSASVLCPGWVATRIIDSARNRPADLAPAAVPAEAPPEAQARLALVRALLAEGFPPAEIAERVYEAVREDRYYVIAAQPDIEESVARRLDEIREQRNPAVVMPEDLEKLLRR